MKHFVVSLMLDAATRSPTWLRVSVYLLLIVSQDFVLGGGRLKPHVFANCVAETVKIDANIWLRLQGTSIVIKRSFLCFAMPTVQPLQCTFIDMHVRLKTWRLSSLVSIFLSIRTHTHVRLSLTHYPTQNNDHKRILSPPNTATGPSEEEVSETRERRRSLVQKVYGQCNKMNRLICNGWTQQSHPSTLRSAWTDYSETDQFAPICIQPFPQNPVFFSELNLQLMFKRFSPIP